MRKISVLLTMAAFLFAAGTIYAESVDTKDIEVRLTVKNRTIQSMTDFKSLLQTYEAYLSNYTGILQRMREITVQGANGIYTKEDREKLIQELTQLADELKRIVEHAQFNGMYILMPQNDETQVKHYITLSESEKPACFTVDLPQYIDEGMQISGFGAGMQPTPEYFQLYIGIVDVALSRVWYTRAQVVAYMARIEYAIEFQECYFDSTRDNKLDTQKFDAALEWLYYRMQDRMYCLAIQAASSYYSDGRQDPASA